MNKKSEKNNKNNYCLFIKLWEEKIHLKTKTQNIINIFLY